MQHNFKSRLSDLEIVVVNPTFEDYSDFPIFGRYFDFSARSQTKIPEFDEIGESFEFPITVEHANLGLFVYHTGDDYKAKELEALSKYLITLETRIANYYTKIDEMKGAGRTIQELPKRLLQAQEWKKQILEVLKRNNVEEVPQSFLTDATDIIEEDQVFASTPEVVEVSKSKKKSFDEVIGA